jgi:hypothetical protein
MMFLCDEGCVLLSPRPLTNLIAKKPVTRPKTIE